MNHVNRSGSDAPVDTLEPPHEPTVATRSVAAALALMLAGPVIWMTHFWVVYLTAEASCAARRSSGISFTGERGLTTIIVVATLAGVAGCGVAAVANHRRSQAGASELSRLGVWLSVGAAVSIVAIGLPIAVLAPC